MTLARKQDFVYLPAEDAYRCPAGEKLTYHATPLLDDGVPELSAEISLYHSATGIW